MYVLVAFASAPRAGSVEVGDEILTDGDPIGPLELIAELRALHARNDSDLYAPCLINHASRDGQTGNALQHDRASSLSRRSAVRRNADGVRGGGLIKIEINFVRN